MNGSKHQKNFNEFAWLKAYNLHFIMIRHSYGKGGKGYILECCVCMLFVLSGKIASSPLHNKWLQFNRFRGRVEYRAGKIGGNSLPISIRNGG